MKTITKSILIALISGAVGAFGLNLYQNGGEVYLNKRKKELGIDETLDDLIQAQKELLAEIKAKKAKVINWKDSEVADIEKDTNTVKDQVKKKTTAKSKAKTTKKSTAKTKKDEK